MHRRRRAARITPQPTPPPPDISQSYTTTPVPTSSSQAINDLPPDYDPAPPSYEQAVSDPDPPSFDEATSSPLLSSRIHTSVPEEPISQERQESSTLESMREAKRLVREGLSFSLPKNKLFQLFSVLYRDIVDPLKNDFQPRGNIARDAISYEGLVCGYEPKEQRRWSLFSVAETMPLICVPCIRITLPLPRSEAGPLEKQILEFCGNNADIPKTLHPAYEFRYLHHQELIAHKPRAVYIQLPGGSYFMIPEEKLPHIDWQSLMDTDPVEVRHVGGAEIIGRQVLNFLRGGTDMRRGY